MRLRRPVQLLLLALFTASLLATTWRVEGQLVDSFLLMDPLLSITASVAARVLLPALWFAALLLLLTALLGRFFCGWVCPLGTLLDLWDELLARLRPRSARPQGRLSVLRFGLLAALLGAALLGANLAWLLDPVTWAKRLYTFVLWPAGAWGLHLVQGLARPLLEASGRYDWAYAVVERPDFGATGLLTVLVFGGLLALSLHQPRGWCRLVCPLGALLSLSAWRPLVGRRVAAGCDASGACAVACPTGAIGSRHRRYEPSECVVCGRCVTACEPAVTRFTLGPMVVRQATVPGRRRALVGLLGGVGLALLPKLGSTRRVRPPGALPEPSFVTTCIRCGQCSRACPTHCLQPLVATVDPGELMCPVAMMSQGPCDLACRACGAVCPTGAIRALDLSERQHAKLGGAVVDEDRCIAAADGKACLICQEHCPLGAIRWEERDGRRVPVVDAQHCNGCGTCEHLCPVVAPPAIQVDPAEEIRLARGSYLRAFRERHGAEVFRHERHPDRRRGPG